MAKRCRMEIKRLKQCLADAWKENFETSKKLQLSTNGTRLANHFVKKPKRKLKKQTKKSRLQSVSFLVLFRTVQTTEKPGKHKLVWFST